MLAARPPRPSRGSGEQTRGGAAALSAAGHQSTRHAHTVEHRKSCHNDVRRWRAASYAVAHDGLPGQRARSASQVTWIDLFLGGGADASSIGSTTATVHMASAASTFSASCRETTGAPDRQRGCAWVSRLWSAWSGPSFPWSLRGQRSAYQRQREARDLLFAKVAIQQL